MTVIGKRNAASILQGICSLEEGRVVEPIDLKEYEWKTVVRRLTMDDFDALIEMQGD